MIKNLSNIQRFFRIILLVIAGAILIAGATWWYLSFPSVSRAQPTEVAIEKGESARSVANTLKDAGLIRSSRMFIWYVTFRGWTDELEAGYYLIPANISMEEISRLIVTGLAHNDVSVLIPEGYNIWQIDERLADAKLVERGQFAKAYYHREGYFFPDTYRFRKGGTMEEIAKKMEDNFNIRNVVLLGPLSVEARDRIVAIASIIEKESLRGSSMNLVAGVIENRVRLGMKLQIDATVSYGSCLRKFLASIDPVTGGTPKNCLVNLEAVGKEIRIDSAYNSYTRKGFPAGPISNPGAAALNAVLNPKGDYLFYLSTRDGSQMLFSHTGAEHEAKRRQYLGL